MRLIAGKYGGFNLEAPQAKSIHPMGERIRGAIFNSLGERIKGATVLDIFAGSGALGLEAISRGAKTVTFVDKDKRAIRAIKTNLARLTPDDQACATVLNLSALGFIKLNTSSKYDLILADPPYNNLPLATFPEIGNLLVNGGLLVLSLPKKATLPNLSNLTLLKTATYADARICYYTKS